MHGQLCLEEPTECQVSTSSRSLEEGYGADGADARLLGHACVKRTCRARQCDVTRAKETLGRNRLAAGQWVDVQSVPLGVVLSCAFIPC